MIHIVRPLIMCLCMSRHVIQHYAYLYALIFTADCIECNGPTSKMCQQCDHNICNMCFNKTHNSSLIFKKHILKNIGKYS